jgi:hypothetical protein
MKAIPRSRLRQARALLAAAALAASVHTEAGPLFFYKFTPIADTQAGFPFTQLDPFPTINGSGRIAFGARFTGGVQGMFTRLGTGGINVLADTGVTPFGDFGIETSINSLNRVAFFGLTFLPDRVTTTILRGEGNSATPLITDQNNGTGLGEFCGIEINNEDSVAFRAERTNGKREIRVQGAGPLNGVFRVVAEEGSEFSSLGCGPSIAHDGTVAFTATRDGRRAIFTRSKDGTQLTRMIDDNSQFASFGAVALNQFGGLAFTAGFHGGGSGLFRLRNGALTQVATASVQGVPAGFSINESGQVAFELTRDANGSSVHIGPNSLFGRILGTGSSLFGQTVSNVHLTRGGLNSTGQVAVSISFFGPVMIARGEPVRFPDHVIVHGGILVASADGGSVNVGTSLPTQPKGSLLTFDLTFLSLGGQLDVKLGDKVVQYIRPTDARVRRTVSVPLDAELARGGLQFVFSGKQGASAQISGVTISGLGSAALDAEALSKWKIDESGRGHAAIVEVARYPMRIQLAKAARDPRKPGVTLVYATVLSDEGVDVTADLEHATLRVAGSAPRACKEGDVNGDKLEDLVCEVELTDASIKTAAVPVEAMTHYGWAIEGAGSFGDPRTLPPR